LCAACGKYGQIARESEEAKKIIDDLRDDEETLRTPVYHAIKRLWADPGIQATFAKSSNFQLGDSTKYFMDRIDLLASPHYVPDDQDLLRSRAGTTGIVEKEFLIQGNTFHLMDVGGQRNERKEWMHCFENVTAVLFVAAINEYDQLLYEDDETNRMREALTLFEDICNSKWFISTSMILFLNKRDIFADKIKRIPLKPFFPEYEGKEGSYSQGAAFMQRLFVSKNKNPDKEVYTHMVSATDTENVRTVMRDVKDICIRRGLARSGLL